MNKSKSPPSKYGKLTIDLDKTFNGDSLGTLIEKAIRSGRTDLAYVRDGSEKRCLAEWAILEVCKLLIQARAFRFNWSLTYATCINSKDIPELRKAGERRGISEFDMAREAVSEWAEARREFTAKLGNNDDDDGRDDERWKLNQ